MLRLILGDASSGKSDRLVSEMVAQAAKLPEEKFFVVVPEQATLKMQQSVVAHLEHGATFNIDVVSFNRLAQVVFSDLGIRTDNILDDTGKVLILRKVLEEVREDLEVYRSKVHLPGFVQRMKSAVTELRQYGIDDNGLYLMETCAIERGNALLSAKLQDLRLISRTYQETIRDAFRGAEELLDLFASKVASAKRLQNTHIYLDGFTGFTPVQYKLLTELLKVAKDVTCAFTLPSGRVRPGCPEYDLFYLSNQTLERLMYAAQEAGCKAEKPFFVTREKKAPEASVYVANDPTDEVSFAAKEILYLVREKGLRYREIAIICSDMESCHSALDKVLSEADIPYFLDYKSTITEHPLSRFLLSALQLKEQRFSYESVFAFLKTGLAGIEADEVSLFENYCLEFGIRGAAAFRNPMTKNRRLHGYEQAQAAHPEDPYAGFAWNLDEINAIRARFAEGVELFLKMLSGTGRSAADYVKALETLLQKNQIEEALLKTAERLSAEGRQKEKLEYEQIYGRVTELLKQTAALSGEGEMTVRDYARILESGLSEIKVGIIPPTLDALVAGDLTRSRLDGVRALFLLGADDGHIPLTAEPTGVFSARDREFFKQERFELSPTPSEHIYNQRFYLHLMLNKPSEYLYLSYARLRADGQEAGPAYLFTDLPELVPGVSVSERSGPRKILWEKEAKRALAASLRKEPEEALLDYFAAAEPGALSRLADAAFFTNVQTDLDVRVAKDLYGEVLSGSVSRYEKFSECPFQHFLLYGVRLEKRPEYEATAADVGTIYHEALERYSKKLKESGISFREVRDADSRRIAEESVKEALEEQQTDIWESTARNAFFIRRLTDVTVKTTDVLREQIAKGLYEPDAYELEFQESLGDTVRFKGKIDRVDLYEGEDLYVKIIDYKSGNKEFKIADLYSGLQLQLVAYLKEAVALYGKMRPEKQVLPGGVYYYRINDRFEKDEESARNRFRMSGLTSCDEGMLRAVDENLSPEGNGESTIVPVSLKKDGSVSANSPVANRVEFSNLMDFVSRKITDISSRILRGEIAAAPHFEQERKNACLYCDYQDVCKFEAGSFGSDWQKKETKTKKEMEAEIYGRVSPE